jgi:glycine cleavage system aminomethyltransferase T
MILNEQGLQDDILVYRNPTNDGFFVVINAGNTATRPGHHARRRQGFDVVVEDCTDTSA